MRVIGTLDTKDVLCKYCQLKFATCPKANHIKFGDEIGNDNVTECSEFVTKRFHSNYPIVGKPELGIFKRARSQPMNNKVTSEEGKIYGPPDKGAEVVLQGKGIFIQIRLDTEDDECIFRAAIKIADKRRYPVKQGEI